MTFFKLFSWKLPGSGNVDPLEFSPPLIRLQESPPSPLGRRVIHVLIGLLAALLVWSVLGRLDIVAVAEGKLVPHSFLKIVQPAEAGIVREILVREGEQVAAGQVLMRMDARLSEADRRILETDFYRKTLTLARPRPWCAKWKRSSMPTAPHSMRLLPRNGRSWRRRAARWPPPSR